MSSLNSHLRTRRFSEVTFRPSRHTKHWKTQHFATSLTFRACWSSFFPHLLIFFLAALLFQLSILSEVRLLNFLWSYMDPTGNRSGLSSFRVWYMPPLNITKKQVDTWDFLHFQPYLEDHPLLSQPFKRLIFPIKYVILKKFKSWPLAESDLVSG